MLGVDRIETEDAVRYHPAGLRDPDRVLADLAKVEAKAELIGGKVIRHLAAGFRPNIVAGRIFRSLASHANATGTGFAFTDNIGFAIMELPSGRESFSPEAAYYFGPAPENG